MASFFDTFWNGVRRQERRGKARPLASDERAPVPPADALIRDRFATMQAHLAPLRDAELMAMLNEINGRIRAAARDVGGADRNGRITALLRQTEAVVKAYVYLPATERSRENLFEQMVAICSKLRPVCYPPIGRPRPRCSGGLSTPTPQEPATARVKNPLFRKPAETGKTDPVSP